MLEGGAAARSKRSISVDLNCDMGEGMDTDAAIFPFISSANIACGAHAGDENTMRRTVELALEQGVAIGAHPSYPDRDNFGRTDMLEKGLSPDQLPDLIFDQLSALQNICIGAGTRLSHVKPHGALYNRAARDAAVSELICRTIAAFDASLLLYGLSGSLMQAAAHDHGLVFVSEVFADRTYQSDGSLTPRSLPNALIEDQTAAINQVIRMVKEGKVISVSGEIIRLSANTICLHGDGAHAVEYARVICNTLTENGIFISAPR